MGQPEDVRAAIDRIVEEFIRQVVAIARREAFEAFAATLPPETAAGLRTRLRLTGSGAASAPETRTVPDAVRAERDAARRRAAGFRERLRQIIVDRPGLRVEQINRALGTTTRDVKQPLRKLVAAGLVRTEGTGRSTVYLPGDGAAITVPPPADAVAPRDRVPPSGSS